mgnify:CR=1 FL=1
MYANLYLKQFLIKLPLKKKPNYSDYKFSIKYPIDYRYLSFNHTTILKVIGNIRSPFVKISYFSHKFLSFKYYGFLKFLHCKTQKAIIKAEINYSWNESDDIQKAIFEDAV